MRRPAVITTMMLALVLGPGSSFAAAQVSAPPSAEPTAAGEPLTGGAFEPAGLLAQPRSNHHALPLADGRVLIAGGVDPDGSRVAELELWDPATSTFGAAGQLTPDRQGYSATLLPDGRVLFIGGLRGKAEAWDPTSGEVTPAGKMIRPPGRHTTAALADGRVLVMGGTRGEDAVVEIWDPRRATFRRSGSMVRDRTGHSSTVLPDGRVLLIGGWGVNRHVDLAELWNPGTESFTKAGRLPQLQTDHTATLLLDGRVLVIAEAEPAVSGASAFATVWDPTTRTFAATGDPDPRLRAHTATLLADGTVLVIGDAAEATIWDPSTGSFEPAGLLARARAGFADDWRTRHSATRLSDGQVMVLDAGSSCEAHSVENRDPVTGAWRQTGSILRDRRGQSVTVLADGRVLVVGGDEGGTAELWDPDLPTPSDDDLAEPAPTYELGRRAAESDLLFGVRRDLYGTCEVVAGDLPAGVVGAVECRPEGGPVGRLRLSLVESQDVLLETYFARLASNGVEPGTKRGCPEGPYLPAPACAVPDLEERDGCFVDPGPRAHYLFTAPPFVLADVVGTGRGAEKLREWAWQDNEDTPGSPTAWRERRQMEAVHRRLEASLPRALACRPSAEGEPERDPFDLGAEGALRCGRLATEGFPAIAGMTLFAFPDAASMEAYWAERISQNPDGMPAREEACASGLRGYGTWEHGEYFCYVSENDGHALLRWTDERTDTYGAIDGRNTRNVKLAPLYRAWTKLRP